MRGVSRRAHLRGPASDVRCARGLGANSGLDHLGGPAQALAGRDARTRGTRLFHLSLPRGTPLRVAGASYTLAPSYGSQLLHRQLVRLQYAQLAPKRFGIEFEHLAYVLEGKRHDAVFCFEPARDFREFEIICASGRIALPQISADRVLEHSKDQPGLAVEKRTASNQVVELNGHDWAHLESAMMVEGRRA